MEAAAALSVEQTGSASEMARDAEQRGHGKHHREHRSDQTSR
jgi:hypothetical protein